MLGLNSPLALVRFYLHFERQDVTLFYVKSPGHLYSACVPFTLLII
jgi:hypothetical protein